MMEFKVPMRVSEMLKTTVENRHKEKLGTIQDFMVGADGRLKYAILSHGGFLGIGDVLIPIPFDALMRARRGLTSLRPNGMKKLIDTLRPIRLAQDSNRWLLMFRAISPAQPRLLPYS